MKVSELKQLIREEVQNVLKESPLGRGFEGDLHKNSLDLLVKKLKQDKNIDAQWPLLKNFITVGKYRVRYSDSDGEYIIFNAADDKEIKTNGDNSDIDYIVNYLTFKPR